MLHKKPKCSDCGQKLEKCRCRRETGSGPSVGEVGRDLRESYRETSRRDKHKAAKKSKKQRKHGTLRGNQPDEREYAAPFSSLGSLDSLPRRDEDGTAAKIPARDTQELIQRRQYLLQELYMESVRSGDRERGARPVSPSPGRENPNALLSRSSRWSSATALSALARSGVTSQSPPASQHGQRLLTQSMFVASDSSASLLGSSPMRSRMAESMDGAAALTGSDEPGSSSGSSSGSSPLLRDRLTVAERLANGEAPASPRQAVDIPSSPSLSSSSSSSSPPSRLSEPQLLTPSSAPRCIDVRGVWRGACLVCTQAGCSEYQRQEPDVSPSCDRCGCPPAKHQRVRSSASSFVLDSAQNPYRLDPLRSFGELPSSSHHCALSSSPTAASSPPSSPRLAVGPLQLTSSSSPMRSPVAASTSLGLSACTAAASLHSSSSSSSLHSPRSSGAASTSDGEHALSWNGRFQAIRRRLGEFSSTTSADAASLDERIAATTELLQLSQDFTHCAKTYGKIIISERYLSEKTIAPRTTEHGDCFYLVQDISFSFGTTSSRNLPRSDDIEHKIAGNELLAVSSFSHTRILDGDICFPLMAIVDYMGFRLLATAALPIYDTTLIYGSLDGGADVRNTDPQFDALIASSAAKLNLKPHRVGLQPHACQTLHIAGDAQGHRGTDGRYYLVNLSRTFPPDLPDPDLPGSHLYRLLRPERVRSEPRPLCSDAFSAFIAHDPQRDQHNLDVQTAVANLKEGIPRAARSLTWLVREAINQGCLESVQITAFLHEHGINMRYLGLLEPHVRDDECRRLIFLEGVARVLKNRLRLLLRTLMRTLSQPLTEPYRQAVIDFFNMVFVDNNEYWRESIPPQLAAHFSFASDWPSTGGRTLFAVCCEPFSGARNPTGKYLLFTRVSQLMGLNFNSFAIRKLASKSFTTPFDLPDLEAIGERIKESTIAIVAQALYFFFRGQIESEYAKAEYCWRAYLSFSEALRTDPKNPILLNICSQSQVLYLDLQHTIEHGKDAPVHFDPSSSEVVAADRTFLRLIDVAQHDPDVLFSYAKFLTKCNRRERAEDFFLRSLEIRAVNPEVLRAYSAFLWQNGNADLANQIFQFAQMFETE